MTPLQIVVNGDPAPQGSKRHVGRGRMVESSKRVAPWRAAVKAACPRGVVVSAPVIVEVRFYVTRPRSHYGTGRNAGLLRVAAPKYPTSRAVGDVDKLIRATLDGLTHDPATRLGVLEDDALVVDVVASKRYAAPHDPGPGAVITILPAT